MKHTLLCAATFAALAGAFAQAAAAQSGTISGQNIQVNQNQMFVHLEGTATLVGAAVTSFQENTTTGMMTVGLRLTNNTMVAVGLQYGVPRPPFTLPPPRLIGADLLDPTVAGLIKKLAQKKQTDTFMDFGNLTFANVHYLSIGSSNNYTVTNATEVTLEVAHVIDVPKASSNNTRGGTVRMTVFAAGARTVEGLSVTSYGKVTLRRNDMGVPYEFDCYPLRAQLNVMDNGVMIGLLPIVPGSGGNDVNSFFDTAMQRQMLMPNIQSAFKVNETRFVHHGTQWTSSF